MDNGVNTVCASVPDNGDSDAIVFVNKVIKMYIAKCNCV